MTHSARFLRFLIVVGVASFALFTKSDRVVAVAGALDPYFGSFGHQTVGFGNGSDLGKAMAVQSDGKMVVVGLTADGGNGMFGVVRFNTDGTLDTSFDSDGKVTTQLDTGSHSAEAVAIQTDGKIVVAGSVNDGSSHNFGVVRYNSDGSLDTTFSTDGKLITAIGSSTDMADGVAIQSDGKIVVVGRTYNVGYKFAVVRYNSDGSLDTTFDTDGIVVTPVGVGDNYAEAVVIQTDGKIVAVGSVISGTGDFAAVRYNTDGSLDSTFGVSGKAIVPVLGSGDYATSVALQSDGKLVIAGSVYNGTGYDIGVIRLLSTGFLDTTFSGDGKVVSAVLSGDDTAMSTGIQTDGKIVVSGTANNGSNLDIFLLRFNSNGSFDLTFDTDGRMTTPIYSGNDSAGTVVPLSDGKILIGGYTIATSTDFLVAKFNSNGSLDTTFDGDGFVNVDVGNAPASCRAVAIQGNGRIIAAGNVAVGSAQNVAIVRFDRYGFLDPTYGTGGVTTTNVGGSANVSDVAIHNGKSVVVGQVMNANEDMVVVRYNNDGTLDTGFDTDGIATIDFGGNSDYAIAVAIQSNGKVVVAGYTSDGVDIDFAVARLNLNGTPDMTFGTGGKVITPVLLGFDLASAVAIQDDGKIIVGGYAANSGSNDFALVRYESDGTIDTTFGILGRVVTWIKAPADTDQINALTIQSDGKIVAAGISIDMTGSDFAVTRYETDGSLDTTFDTDGKAWTDIAATSDEPYSVVIQPDNKIVVGGTAYGSNTDLAMVRYMPNGALDTSFNLADAAPLGTGKVAIDVSGGGDDTAYKMAIDGTGRFIMGGEIGSRFGIARVLGDLQATAANVNVSGRVMTAGGSGVRNAIVTLTDANGTSRTAVTSSFGYYQFDDVAVGQTYVVSAASKRYLFTSRTVTVTDAITDLEITESTVSGVDTRTK